MNKKSLVLKRAMSLVLALVMVLTLIPPMTSQAATKKKNITLYVNEGIYYTDYSKVKSVKSSNKSIVSVKKNKENQNQALLTPKKPGKATVTVKTAYGTHKLTITVKKLAFKVSMKDLGNGSILLSVKNNTKQIFDNVVVNYSLYDISGNEVERNSVKVYSSMPDKTSYATITYNKNSYTLHPEIGGAAVVYGDRSINHSYANRCSSVSVKVTNEEPSNYSLDVTATIKNNYKDTVTGTVYLLLYDSFDNLIGAERYYAYLRANSIESHAFHIYSSTYPDYDHYKIVTRFYSQKRKSN